MEFVILLIAIILFIVFMLAIGQKILVGTIIRPKKSDPLPSAFDIKSFPNENRFTVSSSDGTNISFLYIPVNDSGLPPEKIVMLFHGYNSCAESMRKYARIFLDRGFSVVIPDARYCGKSGGEHLGLVSVDIEDSLSVFRWIKDCFGPNIPIGLFGESFGASQAILLACSGKVDNISFVISDSAFSVLYALLKERVRADYKIKPFPMLTVSRLIIKKKYGIDLKKVKPLTALSSCGDIPIFFIHGDSDIYILPQMSIDLYNAKTTGYKKFYLAENASHGYCFEVDPELYTEKIHEFFNKIKV